MIPRASRVETRLGPKDRSLPGGVLAPRSSAHPGVRSIPRSPTPGSFDDFEQQQRSFDVIEQHRATLATEALAIAAEQPHVAIAGLIVEADAPEAEALLTAIGLPEEARRTGFLGIVPRELAVAILRDVAAEAVDELGRIEAKVHAGTRPLPIVLLAKDGLRLGLASYAARDAAGGEA